MTPTEAVVLALLQTDTEDKHYTPDDTAAHFIAMLPPGSAVVTVETLAVALDGLRYGWDEEEYEPVAAAIIEALR